ncbi:MAG TPA: branched-chain amino acid ABC transporter permease [Thermopetrobacter sp.]|nr:branched-chain amino acid ABC transporter permease [Thermopetrobacter sp.]
MNRRIAHIVAVIALGLVGLFGPWLLPDYLAQFSKLWLFIVLALSWDLLGGQTGYNSFGNVVFFGVGMYASAVVQVGLFYPVAEYTAAKGGGTAFVFSTDQFLTGLALGLPFGGVLAALLALLLGAAMLGMRGHYFAIATLGLAVAAGELAGGWNFIGAGSGMVTPTPKGAGLDTTVLFYYLSYGLAMITFVFFNWLYSTRFRLAINAIRDDEDKAEAMGHFTTRNKTIAWMIGAFFLGVAGGIFGNIVNFIDPIDVAFSGAEVGVWMILMAILGGKGTLWGPVIGAGVFFITKELFWTYLLGWQRVALGALIVVIVVFFPQGIVGWLKERWPGRFAAGHEELEAAETRAAG